MIDRDASGFLFFICCTTQRLLRALWGSRKMKGSCCTKLVAWRNRADAARAGESSVAVSERAFAFPARACRQEPRRLELLCFGCTRELVWAVFGSGVLPYVPGKVRLYEVGQTMCMFCSSDRESIELLDAKRRVRRSLYMQVKGGALPNRHQC